MANDSAEPTLRFTSETRPLDPAIKNDILDKFKNVVEIPQNISPYDFEKTLNNVCGAIATQFREVGVIADDEISHSYYQLLLRCMRSMEGNYRGKLIGDLTTLKEALHLPRYELGSDEAKVLLKEVITEKVVSDTTRIEELVAVSELVEIPKSLIDNPEFQQSLPVNLGKIGDFKKGVLAKYLNTFIPADNRTELVSSGIRRFCCDFEERSWVSPSDEEKIQEKFASVLSLIQEVQGVPKAVVEMAAVNGLLENLDKSEFFHSESIIRIGKMLNIKSLMMSSEGVLSKVKQVVLRELGFGEGYGLNNAKNLCDYFELDEKFTSSNEFQLEIRNGFKTFLKTQAFARHNHYKLDKELFNKWNNFFETYKFSQDLVDLSVSEVVLEECDRINTDYQDLDIVKPQVAIVCLLSAEFYHNKQLLLVPESQQKIVSGVVRGDSYDISADLLLNLPFTKENAERPEILVLAKKKVSSLINRELNLEDFEKVKLLQEKFGVERSYLVSELGDGIAGSVYSGNKNSGLNVVKEMFQLSDEEFYQFVALGLVRAAGDHERNYLELPERLEKMLAERKKQPGLFITDETLLGALPFAIRDALKADQKIRVIALNKFYAAVSGNADLTQNKELQEAYRSAVIRWFKTGEDEASDALYLLLQSDNNPTINIDILKDEDVGIVVDAFVAKSILSGRLYDLNFGAIRLHGLAPFVDRPVVDEARKVLIRKIIHSYQHDPGELSEFSRFINAFHLPETDKTVVIVSCIEDSLVPPNFNLANLYKAMSVIGEKDPEKTVGAYMPSYLSSLMRNFELNKLDELADFVSKNKDYAVFLAGTPEVPSLLKKTDLDFISNLPIGKDMIMAELAKSEGIDLSKFETEEDYHKLFKAVRGRYTGWRDEQTVCGPFQEGADVFGYRRMFSYISREGLTLHDAVHAFRDVVNLYKSSGLSSDQFYGQILSQVMIDDATYQAGTAQHNLNEIAKSMNMDYSQNLIMAHEFSEIEGIGELVDAFSTPDQIFSSWNSLKHYSRLAQLLGEGEVLEALKSIQNPKLRKYVTRLAFHKDSKVDMQAALEFATDPKGFLERQASHTPEDIHDRKKPSNYINIPNLDLSAQELVEALVDGKMDALSVFSPMEIHYRIIDDERFYDLRGLLRFALGTNGGGGVAAVVGGAQDPKKLFYEVTSLLKQYGITTKQFLTQETLSGVKDLADLDQKISSLILNEQFGLSKSAVKTQEYVAKIGRKSDPNMVLAGDDTVNCMPFGDGKTTVYTFNPNTSQFVIQIVKANGARRTVAQSVLTKDIDIQRRIPEVINLMQNEGGHLADVLPESILLRQNAYIGCDNVEVSPNYTGQKRVITALYRDFFRQYLDIFSRNQRLNTTHVVVGEGYSDALNEIPEISNTFAPQAPVSYSDKTGGNVRVLEMDKSDTYLVLKRDIVVDDLQEKSAINVPALGGLEFLTFEHALQVAYVEGKAYSDNVSLMQYLYNMENGLIAKDINNAAKGRPNMSLAYRDSTGKMLGYMFAYEGKLSDEDTSGTIEVKGTYPVLYLADLAVIDKTTFAGAKAGASLIQGFVQLYKEEYLDRGNLMPIFTQAREETSYRLIQRKLGVLSQEAGVQFDVEELPAYMVGDSVMHPVFIRPKKL